MPKGSRKHGNLSGKKADIYEALRRKGYGKTKSAKIANSYRAKRKK